jgi:hypothetical protein
VILLDGYARADTFTRLFDADNEPFLAALESRGFEVSPHSRSNYLGTSLTLASMFNMVHLDAIPGLDGLSPSDPHYLADLRERIDHNEAFDQLRDRGYGINVVSSGFTEVSLRSADRFVDTGQPNEFEIGLLRATGLAYPLWAASPGLFPGLHRQRVRDELAALGSIPSTPGRPRFVYAHVPSPHAPFVFGPEGQPLDPTDPDTFYEDTRIGRGLDTETFARRYVDQAHYLNGLVLQAIDRILAQSAAPPVIIVMSDHGSASGFDWQDPANSDLNERSANFFAALTPGRSKVFGDDITPVNVFRRLFGAYFGAQLPDQPNTVYRWEGDSFFNTVPAPVDP